ncbi:pentapeptide repeat-containing protein [Leptolyngbya sp. CCNP1308]|uniref:pentapeptide repeat-containing protein n=1 Tax=Leptolyngbya sp. CCNP1308 TaxID=3110255 RepID=UPI002B1E99BD|nr:pentapeptide repeat-containing protein [Leptolyngbya sp. CCNP1308]MEA5451291.1 pentapeptide repeat-containing protein [Leptolyngbya sp. CCNP1308]
MQRLTAKELQRRYRAGERNFAGVDLNGESLRGINLKSVDLANADLSCTDLRGTNFTKANLEGTQFIGAKAGTQRRWLLPQLLITVALATTASLLADTLWIVFASSFVSPSGETTGSVTGDTIFGVLGIVLFLSFWGLIYTKGVLEALGVALGAFVVTFVTVFAGSFVGSADVAGDFAVTVTVDFAFAIASAIASAVAFAIEVVFSAVFSVAVLVIFAVVIRGYESSVIAIACIGSLAGIMVSFIVARRALLRDHRDSFIRNISIWLRSCGGTNFVGSNLTDASFQEAILKSTHLYEADLTRTNFHLSKKVNLSRLGKTILANFPVQNLLVTLRGSGQSYVGLNLKGAYLVRADLADADFTEADLSQATLEGATLERANLTKTQVLGTNFHQTILTGVTLEAWNIDSTTQLKGATGDYVYLLRNQQERRPSSGSFAPGEFSKLFQEVLDTIDLIFQNGVDWKAFVRTFNNVQEQYDNADLGVQAIENKGDGVVVVKLHAAPDADKPAIHQSFTEIYQLALQEAEARYKAQLDTKDDQIADYRQQSANMQEVVKLLAQRPINVDVKATAESKAMQGNDNSRNISIGGSATGNVFQTGDGNIAAIEFQQVTLPPPDRVNIQAELAALQAILAGLNDPVTTGIAAKLDAEAAKPAPDKSIVATTLETGLTYARNLQGFAEAIDKLRPHVQNAAGWLGEHGTKLLPLVGLVL